MLNNLINNQQKPLNMSTNKAKAISLALALMFAVGFSLTPNRVIAESGTYYGSGDSGTYYGGGDSGTYYGGDSGTYYGASSPSSYSAPSSSYYSYTPVSTYDYVNDYGSYGCSSCGYSSPSYYGGGYSAPSYSYVPQASYQYIPYNSYGGTGGYGGSYGSGGGSGYQYVSSSNTNNNANDNTVTNTFNPTNNNDARINLIVYGGGQGQTQTDQNYQQYVPNYVNNTSYTDAYSYPTYPISTYVSYASQNGNNQNYGSNNSSLGTPVSGVFLSQVPETGVGFGIKMTLFTLGLTLWSIFAAFMIARKK
ncbi:MAG: hypothetical protein K9M11_04825, partial [Candidatus Pacebacteria bacterium]|nr:hypothetical protein [Candidatus Paceibacterota bacterium]